MDTRKRSIKDLKDNVKSLEKRSMQARREFGRKAAASGVRGSIHDETLAELDLIQSAVASRKKRAVELEGLVRAIKSVSKELAARGKELRSLSPSRARLESSLGERLFLSGSEAPAFREFKLKCDEIMARISFLETAQAALHSEAKSKGVFKSLLSGGKAAVAAAEIKARRLEMDSILRDAGKALFDDLAKGLLDVQGLDDLKVKVVDLVGREKAAKAVIRDLEGEKSILTENLRGVAGDVEPRRFLAENKRDIKRLEAETDAVFVSIADEIRAREPNHPLLAEILVLEAAIVRDKTACARLERASEYDALAVKKAKLESRLNSLPGDEEEKARLKRKLAGEISDLETVMSAMRESSIRPGLAEDAQDDFTIPDLD